MSEQMFRATPRGENRQDDDVYFRRLMQPMIQAPFGGDGSVGGGALSQGAPHRTTLNIYSDNVGALLFRLLRDGDGN